MDNEIATNEVKSDRLPFWEYVFSKCISKNVEEIIDFINNDIDYCPDRTFRSTWFRASDDYKKVLVKSMMRDIAAVICQTSMPNYNKFLIEYANNE